MLAHGAFATVCPVEASRSIARALDEAHKPARFIEFDGPHTMPIEEIRALAAFISGSSE